MPIKQLDIDVDAISSLKEAKEVIRAFLNNYEQVFQLCEKREEKIALLEKEIARLKKQPQKPQFGSSQQASTTPTQLLKEQKKHWHKSARTKLEIDQDI